MFLAGGPLVGGVAGSYIAANLGYRYIFWISAALIGFVLLLEIFLVPETLFVREHVNREQVLDVLDSRPLTEDGKFSIETIETRQSADDSAEKFTYVRSLKVGIVRHHRGHFWQHAFGPWLSLAFPGTWIVMLQ